MTSFFSSTLFALLEENHESSFPVGLRVWELMLTSTIRQSASAMTSLTYIPNISGDI